MGNENTLKKKEKKMIKGEKEVQKYERKTC